MTTLANVERPAPGEYAPYFETYLKHVSDEHIFQALEDQIEELRAVLAGVSEEEASVLHGPYTWTIKQVVGHMIDTEAIFAYRARCFAAQEKTSLPGFEQDDYVANSDYTSVPLSVLLDELIYHRNAFLCFCQRLRPEEWMQTGNADNKPMSVRAIAYIQLGHVRHHLAIVKKRLAGEV